MKTKINLLETDNNKFIESACKIRYKSLKCKSCKKYLQLNKKLKNKQSSKTLKLHNKYSLICDKCSTTNPKKCTSKQLKLYSKWYYGK